MSWAFPRLTSPALALAAMLVAAPAVLTTVPAQASDIAYVVNGKAVTSFDIQHRAAFLKLQHKKGNLAQMAADDMVTQELQAQELARLRIRVSDQQVNAAFAKFAASNKLTTAQMSTILDRAGVTAQHFKEYIRAQMGWGQALSMRARSESGGGRVSEQEAVRRMMQSGANKPSATEYMLQQVIFVVPDKDKARIGAQRRREAENMRSRFSGCDSTRQFAKGLIDVTVRDLGRVLAPQLPNDWADSVKATNQGQATKVRETDRGYEFIGVCSAKEVSDDRVAQMVFAEEGQKTDPNGEALSKKYNEELRKRAKIIQR